MSKDEVEDCVLLNVKVVVDKDRNGAAMVANRTAYAVLNDWAAVPLVDNISDRCAVCHIPTGRKTGPIMTKLEAMKTVNKLRDVHITIDNVDTVIDIVTKAHPVRYRTYFAELKTKQCRGLEPFAGIESIESTEPVL